MTFLIPSGYLTVRHGIDGPNRNRWFTVLKHGGSFHGKLLNSQRAYHFGIGFTRFYHVLPMVLAERIPKVRCVCPSGAWSPWVPPRQHEGLG